MTARVAIVTGGASGIGRAIASALVERGDTVTIADIDTAGAEQVAGELSKKGPGTATAAKLDVTDAAAVAELYNAVADQHGRLDLVFNNAGIAVGGTMEELTLDHWNRTIDVNLRGVVHGVHAAYPIMIRQRHGHIINTASMAGLVPAPIMIPYTATKHAVVGLSLALRAEAAEYGVKVSVVCPGFVDTPLLSHANPGLPQTEAGRRARELAIGIQRSLYPAGSLAGDVLRGIDKDTAVIVAPTSALLAWRAARMSPSAAVRVAARQVNRFRKETSGR